MLRISVIGGSYWPHYIQRYGLDSRFQVSVISGLRDIFQSLGVLFRSDRVLVLGHGVPVIWQHYVWFCILLLVWVFSLKRPIFFMYWIGSEVYTSSSRWQLKIYLWLSKSNRVRHICGAPWFEDVLALKGIQAKTVLFPYDTHKAYRYVDHWPNERQLIVSTYLTTSHWENSKGDWIVKLCGTYPDVKWRIIGMDNDIFCGELNNMKNVDLCGWVDDPQEVVSKTHMFIRLAQNDAYAGTVRDAQRMQRIVIYTKPIGDCINVSSEKFESFAIEFDRIYRAFKYGDAQKIKQVRSTGKTVPMIEQGRKLLSDLIACTNA